ncbi:MAG: phosphonate C-P lyase system protein PhnH [Zoogloeaceae bacterium]|jgi:alpha-D-ribose 1-methylphosphonate 5-triphosphate synthase subunit PhnH|nr:phosphonate C-P lyase system protein PhnH [Zoogloeaceae bacterium]
MQQTFQTTEAGAMNAPSTALPGFSNPIDDARIVFRAARNALSRPGIPVSLTTLPSPLPGAGFSQGMLALALTLCDSDTPVWLDAAADTPEVRRHLRAHSASPITANPSEASFAFITQAEEMPRLYAFRQGKPDFPDRSTTLIIRANLSGCHELPRESGDINIKGSGRGEWQDFRRSGLPGWFWDDWKTNHAAYPLGVDVLFVDSGADHSGAPCARLMGLPRTARVRASGRYIRESSRSFARGNTVCM